MHVCVCVCVCVRFGVVKVGKDGAHIDVRSVKKEVPQSCHQRHPRS